MQQNYASGWVFDSLECPGLCIDPVRNRYCLPDIEVSADNILARNLVIHTWEDPMIACETYAVFREQVNG